MRKLIAYIILFSMILHCSSRLGLVSYIYQQRHQIAYSLGLTAEKVIAMCKSDYHQQNSLVYTEGHDSTGTVPVAHEITLFTAPNSFSVLTTPFILIDTMVNHYQSRNYHALVTDIFHPPSLVG